MDDDQALRLEARGAGLARLLETHRAELEDARAAAQRLVSGIARDLHMYDEPAGIFNPFQINHLPSATGRLSASLSASEPK